MRIIDFMKNEDLNIYIDHDNFMWPIRRPPLQVLKVNGFLALTPGYKGRYGTWRGPKGFTPRSLSRHIKQFNMSDHDEIKLMINEKICNFRVAVKKVRIWYSTEYEREEYHHMDEALVLSPCAIDDGDGIDRVATVGKRTIEL